jgi:hypothetical protein
MAFVLNASGRLAWRTPAISAEDIANEYVRLVSELEGVKAAKVAIEGSSLVFYTLISPSRKLEERLHKVELALSEWAVDAPLSFRILDNKAAFAEASPVDAIEFIRA